MNNYSSMGPPVEGALAYSVQRKKGNNGGPGWNNFYLHVRYNKLRYNQLVGKKHCYVKRIPSGMGRINIVFEPEAFYGRGGAIHLDGSITMERCLRRTSACAGGVFRYVPTASWRVNMNTAMEFFRLAIEEAGYAQGELMVRMGPKARGSVFRTNIPSLCRATDDARTTYLEFARTEVIRRQTDGEGEITHSVDEWAEDEMDYMGESGCVPNKLEYDLGGLELTPQELENQIIVLNDMDETAKWLEALYNY